MTSEHLHGGGELLSGLRNKNFSARFIRKHRSSLITNFHCSLIVKSPKALA